MTVKYKISDLPEYDIWITKFMSSSQFKKLCEEVDKFTVEKTFYFDQKEVKKKFKYEPTVREKELLCKNIDIQPFYILDYISFNSSEVIYDIGCGRNFFSKFYKIIGVERYTKNADIKEIFNLNFVEKYKNSFPNAITINAIHFCSICKIEDYINRFISLVRENGFVYIAINTAKIIEYSSNEDIAALTITISEYFDNLIKHLPYEILFYENTVDENSNAYINGNVKILLKNTKRETNGTFNYT